MNQALKLLAKQELAIILPLVHLLNPDLAPDSIFQSINESGRMTGAFQHLILVAPPHFLGLIREYLDNPMDALVRATLDKDYSQEGEPELIEHLTEILCR